MSNVVSRRQFLKGSLATAAGVALFGAGLSSKAEKAAAGMYTPGTYSATARGMESEVTVAMTFDADAITDVKIDVTKETAGIGASIGETMEKAILDAQGYEIDAVTGASVTSEAIRKAAAACIAQATGSEVVIEDSSTPAPNTDWLGEEPVVAENEITAEYECDVLVIGAGTSGTFAAASAAEEGVKTILIERFPHDMASGIRDTLAACGSREQKEDGDDVDKTTAINHLCNWSQGYTRRSLAKLWADNSGETVDWFTDRLAEGGMEFRHEIDDHSLPSNYEFLDVGHSTQYTSEYYEQLTMDKVFDYALSKGLQIDYETTMVKLEKDGERVCGIIATNAAGEYVRYKAAKGVIVATGGYGMNSDMMAALQPHTQEMIGVNFNKAGSKGDGIKACLWAGAIMDTVHTSMIFDRACIKPDEIGLPGKSVPGAWFWMGSQPFLKVNLRGERFMNEYQPYDYVLHSASGQPGHTFVDVWDSKYEKDIERFATHGCSRLYPHENGTQSVFPMEMIVGMNADLEAQGYIVRADSIEELAEKLNIPVDTFKATVERYNELAAKGVDEDFGKEGYRLSTLDTAPFFGTRQCGGYFICTMDGIQIDDNMHAIRADGSPIEGLYVIGDCSGSYFAGSYPNLMGGAAAGRSVTFGRLAGKYAAQGI